MTQLINVEDVLEMTLVCGQRGQTALNKWHYVCTAITGSGATDDDVAIAFDTTFAGPYKDLLANTATFLGTQIQIIAPQLRDAVHTEVSNGAGVAGAEPLPLQTCGIFTKTSAFAGRANRGRSYVAFPAEADNTSGGVPGGGYMTRLATFAGLFGPTHVIIGAAGTIDLRAIIWRRATQSLTNWLAVVPRNKWATQRRRGDYGRPNGPPWT